MFFFHTIYTKESHCKCSMVGLIFYINVMMMMMIMAFNLLDYMSDMTDSLLFVFFRRFIISMSHIA